MPVIHPTLVIRPAEPVDAPAWRELYRQYGEFYQTPVDDDVLDRIWNWLLDTGHSLNAILAIAPDNTMVGLAHYRAFPETLLGRDAGFLDDLFVLPAQRGKGVGRSLIHGVAKIAKTQGWPFVRWITADDNASARRLYDELAVKTRWVTYDMKPTE
ncbi:GNAT family N-acetyltransferase [Mesorhizobium sp. 1M-11]|uniref:GNAT family N-acetyltransferase n=1 Tax=Mesorhizobium sp. 1M-11 TaxID=1529006 RepID=UPI0006C76208|nr:GNAT family N-acetyltransferase [Mesorhizobium sp. 1M-11]